MAEGTGIHDLENPDRILIGSMDTPSGQTARDELIKVYERWVPRENLITTNLWSSELSKLVSNAFLAQRISSINSISGLCEVTKADVDEVARAVGKDSRIGPKFLRAGLGFGGSCFRKDILNLVYLCEHFGLQPVADFWQQVVTINDYQMERFVQRIISAMFNSVVGKKIALFGFAFKPDTGDTRVSPVIHISKMLLKEQPHLCITDPHALKNAQKDLECVEGEITYEPDPYKAAEGAHAITLMTEWDQYKALDYKRIFDSIEKPAFLFDGRNHLNGQALFDLGFNVYSIGKPDQTQFDDLS